MREVSLVKKVEIYLRIISTKYCVVIYLPMCKMCT